MDILTFWQSFVLPLLNGVWIGGLLAATVWRIGRRYSGVAANVVATLIGVAAVPINFLLIASSSGDQWCTWLISTVIVAIVFWLVLLADVGTSVAFMLALIVSCILSLPVFWAIPTVSGAFLISWPVWIVAVIGREILRALLPEKYNSQLCFRASRALIQETGIGHAPHL
ncbi:MAG: hypothetical protein H7Y37_18310 [Anaerolineae bacterium]|nr:hypothetical protein [Gloeobacterales cyanobacterium ES-bin-313]